MGCREVSSEFPGHRGDPWPFRPGSSPHCYKPPAETCPWGPGGMLGIHLPALQAHAALWGRPHRGSQLLGRTGVLPPGSVSPEEGWVGRPRAHGAWGMRSPSEGTGLKFTLDSWALTAMVRISGGRQGSLLDPHPSRTPACTRVPEAGSQAPAGPGGRARSPHSTSRI